MEVKDFLSCKYDVHVLSKDQKCIDRYPDLAIFKSIFDRNDLPKSLTPDFVLRYLILTYTPSSPFVKERMSDIKTRKTKVLEYLGISKQSQVTADIEKLATLSDVAIAARWITFLRIQSNEDWLFLVNAQERYVKLIEESVSITKKKDKKTGEDTDDVDALDESRKNTAIQGLRNQIKEGVELFMAGERSKLLEQLVSFSLLSDSNNIMPEQYIPIWAESNKLPYDLNQTGL